MTASASPTRLLLVADRSPQRLPGSTGKVRRYRLARVPAADRFSHLRRAHD